MTVVVTHTTPADSTFSSTGAAAWNADHALSGVGTMAEQDANNVAITGGTINNTTIGATTPAAGTFTTLGVTTSINASSGSANADLNVNSKGTGNVNIGTGNGTQFRVESSGSAATGFVMVSGSSTGRPFIRSASASGNIDLAVSSQGTGAVRLYTNYVVQEQARVSHTASAVNYVNVTGAATTGAPVISSQGSDTNVALSFSAKGAASVGLANSATAGAFGIELAENTTVDKTTFIDFHSSASTDFDFRLSRNPSVNGNAVYQNVGTGSHVFYTASSANQFTVAHTASAVNYVQVTGAVVDVVITPCFLNKTPL